MGGGQIPWKKALRNTWMAPMCQGRRSGQESGGDGLVSEPTFCSWGRDCEKVVVRPDAISTSLCRLRRLTNECRLEEEQNTRDFPLFKPKSGGDISYVVPTKLKSGGDASPPSPTDLRPCYVHNVTAAQSKLNEARIWHRQTPTYPATRTK